MNKLSFSLIIGLTFLLLPVFAQNNKYSANWESLEKHPVPAWFSQAKFGLYIHWGISSVPAYSNPSSNNSAEWYAPEVMYKPWRNEAFHKNNYGAGFSYRDFAALFKAAYWDPQQWAEIFAGSGAKYVIFPAKSYDGYCLWETADTHSAGWNSMETGPKRDLLGELSQSVKRNRMKFGVAYSLLEWESTQTNWPFTDIYANERTGYYIPKELWNQYHIEDSAFVDHLHFQLKELVNKYKPDLIFANGAWDHPDTYWRSNEFLAWLYNNAPNKRSILVNDRWGNNTSGDRGDYFTCEYSEQIYNKKQSWERSVGIGPAYGYMRRDKLEAYKTSRELIEILCRTVGEGENLLLHIGAKADGTIPLIQQQKLVDIGKWLDVNGKAIYYSLPAALENRDMTFTMNGDKIYAFLYSWTQGTIKIGLPEEITIKNCKLLGHDSKLVWKQKGRDLLIIPPVISPDDQDVKYVYVFQLLLNQN